MSSFLHIIFGPMFSGKTTKLMNEVNRLKIYKKEILIINSKKDTRVESNSIKTHDNILCDAYKTNKLTKELACNLSNIYDVIAIDEAQFFDDLHDFVETLLFNNKYVIVSGLNGDRYQKKFGFICDLIPLANKIDKLNGICNICNDGTIGDFTSIKNNIGDSDNQVLIGDNNIFICVCRKHIL